MSQSGDDDEDEIEEPDDAPEGFEMVALSDSEEEEDEESD